MKRWLLKQTKIDTEQMARELRIRPATARVLANRALASRKNAFDFLHGTGASLADARQMKDMGKALELIAQAIAENKRIVIYGDYDVDGVMSISILTKAIRRCGGTVSFYIPHRQREGYGLNLNAVETLAAEGAEVLFTCDNGIAAIPEIALAKEKGMTVIVLDHHEPGFSDEGAQRQDILPAADAVIDPKQKDCPYPFSLMCAAGISYRFALLLLERFGISDEALEREILSFAAIATVCDIVDLTDENRILVRLGLPEIQKTENIGLRALITATGLTDKKLTEYHLGFIIGPCINAAGRLESATEAAELFAETDEARALERANLLAELNTERRNLTLEAEKRTQETLESGNALEQPVLVLYDPQIHESVAGIAAGRIKDKYYRPTILITGSTDGAKGSGRSIEGYHMFEALFACRDLFTRFGGHAMAAGLSLPVENIAPLRERLNAACTLTEEQLTPSLRIEKQLAFSEIDMQLAKELAMLAPFGKGNPTPLFGSKRIHVDRFSLIGKNADILRLTLSEDETGPRLQAISFDGYEAFQDMLKELYPPAEYDKIWESGRLPNLLDMVYSIGINTYNGRESVQLTVKDFRLSE